MWRVAQAWRLKARDSKKSDEEPPIEYAGQPIIGRCGTHTYPVVCFCPQLRDQAPAAASSVVAQLVSAAISPAARHAAHRLGGGLVSRVSLYVTIARCARLTLRHLETTRCFA